MSVVKVNFAQTLKQAQEQARIKASEQKPRLTAQELEYLILTVNEVNAGFVQMIQLKPEAKFWTCTLETVMHFDERLTKGLELVSKDYPEVSFTALNPHKLVFTLERSAIEPVDQDKEEEVQYSELPPEYAEQILRALFAQG